MNQILEVKGKQFGQGRPVICIPVMESKKDAIVAEIKRLAECKVDMIEWRVDAFENVNSLNAIREVLNEVAPHIEETVFLYTFRSKQQGGESELEYEKIYDIHMVAAESKIVDFIDVEYFANDNMDEEIKQLQGMGTRVITSHHDFDETPSDEVIMMLLEQMAQSGCDIVKLAVMPNTFEDVLLLLEKTNEFHKKYPGQPLVTMAMGRLGVLSRISGEFTGSCITFGAGKRASAPGQIQMDKLSEILETIGG